MQKIISRLKTDYPDLRFTPGKEFYWSPETGEIFYKVTAAGQKSTWSLLHETGHALLGHQDYEADFELLLMEVAAWEKAREIAEQVDITIDEDHIEDCLDTYRDWLHKRSICPTCTAKSLQQDNHRHYRCFNCRSVWRVSTSRFCRAYRSTKNIIKNPAEAGLF